MFTVFTLSPSLWMESCAVILLRVFRMAWTRPFFRWTLKELLCWISMNFAQSWFVAPCTALSAHCTQAGMMSLGRHEICFLCGLQIISFDAYYIYECIYIYIYFISCLATSMLQEYARTTMTRLDMGPKGWSLCLLRTDDEISDLMVKCLPEGVRQDVIQLMFDARSKPCPADEMVQVDGNHGLLHQP